MITFFVLLLIWAVIITILGIIIIKIAVELYQPPAAKEFIKTKTIKKNGTKRIRKSVRKL
jgi:hypothetical protein